MTIELLFYIFICFLSLLFVFIEKREEYLSRKKFHLAFFIGVIWFVIVRVSGFDIDIAVYSKYLENDMSIFLMLSNLYFLREFVFWIPFMLLGKLIQNEILVFLIIDIIVLYYFIKTVQNFKLPLHTFFLLLCFFPNMMGYENVYRQYISIIFVLYAISLAGINKTLYKSLIYLMIAGFCHNLAFLFVPIILFLKNKIKLGFAVSLLIYLSLPIVASSKSEGETGDVPAYFFVGTIFVLGIIYLTINLLKPNKIGFYILLFITFLSIESLLILTGVASKRIVMSILNVIVIFTLKSLQESKYDLKSYYLILIVLNLFMLLPSYLSKSSLQMLLTSNFKI
ncbi:hypothetical protein ACILE9_01670 [Capnocytophaga cynodegmi]|uniref:hypothetical protein n=1 Tax=Capnocytophaga cynodegmi TaxID=28189 RepID=UPI0037CD61D0